MQVVDTATGEQLGSLSNASINSGINSPYPSDTTAPVPSASLNVVSKDVHDLMYHAGNTGALVEGTAEVYRGVLSSTGSQGDSGLGSLNMDHVTSRLNQDITTRPVVSSGFDGGDGREIIKGALRHWASECGVFEDGVRGDVRLGLSNDVPGIGYYDHPTKRLIGTEFEGGTNVNQWVPTESAAVDPGFGLGIGESLNLVVGFNSSTIPTLGVWSAEFGFTSGQSFSADESSDTGAASLLVSYNPFTDSLAIWEKRAGKATTSVINVGGAGPGYILSTAQIKLTRTSATTVKYDLRLYYGAGQSVYVASVSRLNSYLPTSLAVQNIDLTAKGALTGFRTWEGVGSVYILDGSAPDVTNDEWFNGGVRFDLTWPASTAWTNVAIPGIAGNCWQMINDLATTYGLLFDPLTMSLFAPETLVSGTNQKFLQNASGVGIQVNARQRAETVEIVNYNYKTSKDVFDNIQLFKADTAYAVGLGERQENVVQTDATFSFLSQPVCVTVPQAIKVNKNPNNGQSVYSVYDSDNLEVDPATWRDGGGEITVESTETPGELKIIIQAPNNALATRTPPFIISIESTIPSLVVSGVGSVARKETLTVYTGAGSGIDINKVGTTYDNPLVGAEWIAWNMGAGLGALYGTSYTTASGNFAKEGYFSPVLPIRRKGSYYLPLSISNSASATNISTATRYNSCKAINREHQGKTCADVNALFAGKNVRYANMSPLPQIMEF